MKKIKIQTLFLVLIMLASAMLVSAQSKKEKKGDKLMEKYYFLAASDIYLKVSEQDNENIAVKKKLAECYRMLNDPAKTAVWYETFIDNSDDPTDKLYYAQALSGIGDYAKAKIWYDAYLSEVPDDDRAQNFSGDLAVMDKLYALSDQIEIKKAGFNSKFSDFSPTYYRKGLVFVSARGEKSDKFKWNESAFLDLYFTEKNPLGAFSEAQPFYKKINSKYHEGPAVFYENDGKLVFTGNNYEAGTLQKSSEGVSKLKLYFASVEDDGNWSDIESFVHNNNEYSVGHPAISQDGTTLYFSSDMPGGFGGTDLYTCTKTANGWSQPQNLGAQINTTGNEVFPFLYDNETLYFASNGLGGLGSLDIFKYDLTIKKVKNVGFPINSSKDDFGLIINDENEGYFSSNRDTPDGSDNIYQFKITVPQNLMVKVLVVEAETNTPIVNSDISIITGNGPVSNFKTNDSGYVEIPVGVNREYDITATKTGFTAGQVYFASNSQTKGVLIKLEKNCQLARGVVQLSNKGSIDGISVVLINKESGERDTVKISANEYYEFCVEPQTDYLLKINRTKYFAQSVEFTTNESPALELQAIILEEILLDKAIKLDDIYYDLGKSNIRPDAAKELDKLVKIMEDNPTIEIELSSHTDSRGGDAFNLELSDKRANSATDYIISQGIDSSRISAKGYGETVLINRCANGVTCTPEEHQANRRTEFMVLKY